MRSFIIRRLIETIFTIFFVTIIAFILVHLVPGDPIVSMVGTESLTAKGEIERLRHELGFDQPLIIQYVQWLGKVIQGDLGTSLRYRVKVSHLIIERIPVSLLLIGLSFSVSIIIGIPAGILTAIRRGKLLDSVITTFSNLGIAIPVFWFGIMLIYLFGVKLGWLPIGGYTSPLKNFWLSVRQMIMPVLCLSFFQIAILVRQTRSSMLEVIHQDYIRTAWSKGLSENVVIFRHALKNGLIPVVTIGGVLVAYSIGGAVLTETIFNIPGLGRLIMSGVLQNDFILVQGCTLVFSLLVAFINLVVDISYAWFDPRIRLS